MPSINIEKKVFGSLTNERGDGVLAYTSGISAAADNFSTLLTSNAQAPMSDKYASLYFLTNPDNGLLTLLHAQGSMTVFPGMARAYDTRAIYEIRTEDFMAAGAQYTSLIAALDGMHTYTQRHYGVSAATTITPHHHQPDATEQMLTERIAYCVFHGRQLFIRIGQDEDLHADHLRQSRRLLAITHAIDALPQAIRPFVSMGFSLDAATMAVRTLADHLTIIVHHDPIERWGNAQQHSAIIDWQGATPQPVNAPAITAPEQQLMEESSRLVRAFLGSKPATRANISALIGVIPQNVDKAIGTPQSIPNANEMRILEAVICSPEGSYRQRDVADKLFFLLSHNYPIPKVAGRMLQLFPHLRSAKEWDAIIDQYLQRCDNTDKVCRLYDVLHLADNMKEKALQWLFKHSVLLNGMPRHADTQLGKDLQPSIAKAVKKVNNNWKVDHLEEPYFQLTPDDIELTDWYAFSQVVKALENKPQGRQQLADIHTNAREWGATRMDMNVFMRVRSYMTTEDTLTLLKAVLKAAPTLYVDIMDNLMGKGEGDPKAMIFSQSVSYRHAYIVLQAKQKSLSQVRPIVFGPHYEVLDEGLVQFCDKNGLFSRKGFIVTLLDFYHKHQRLDDKSRSAFLAVMERRSTAPTLSKLLTAYASLMPYLPEYVTAQRIQRAATIGDPDRIEQAIKDMVRNHCPQTVVDTAREHAHKLLLAACPRTYDQLLEALSKPTLTPEHFYAFDNESDILMICPGMTINDWIKLYRQCERQGKELRRISRQAVFERALSAYAMAQIPSWFQTQDISKSHFVKAIASLHKPSIKWALMQMSHMKKDQLNELKGKFLAYFVRRHRNEEAFRESKRTLQPALDALVGALRQRGMLEADSPLLKHASRQATHSSRFTMRRSTLKWGAIATAFILVVGLVVGGIIYHQTSKTTPPTTAVADSDSLRALIPDSLLGDSLLRDSLSKDSIRRDSLSRDSIKKAPIRKPAPQAAQADNNDARP